MAQTIIEVLFLSLLSARSVLVALLYGGSANHIYMGKFNPVGTNFPQITMVFNEDDSEPVIPAKHGTLIVNAWFDDALSPRYSVLRTVKSEILAALDLNMVGLTDIDAVLNEGVRVVECINMSATIDYNDQVKKYQVQCVFDLTYSYNESFLASDAGDQAWT